MIRRAYHYNALRRSGQLSQQQQQQQQLVQPRFRIVRIATDKAYYRRRHTTIPLFMTTTKTTRTPPYSWLGGCQSIARYSSSSGATATTERVTQKQEDNNNNNSTGGGNESSTTTTANDVAPVPFLSPKVEDLFHRITKRLSADEVKQMGNMILNDVLGRPMREREFYWRGIGGKRMGRGKKSDGEVDENDIAAAAIQKKSTFDLSLVSFDSKAKIKIIKEVRAITEAGLKEAKELVESAPKVIKKDLKKEQAEELQKKLEELGAKVDLV